MLSVEYVDEFESCFSHVCLSVVEPNTKETRVT